MSSRSLASLPVTALLLTLACSERELSSPLSGPESDLRSAVVGEAAAALDSNGQFRLQSPPSSADAISAETARRIAEIAVRRFGPYRRPYLERVRGAPIDFASLRSGTRVYFGESPYEQTDLRTENDPAFRKHVGPFLLVSMWSGSTQVLSVAVSVRDTDIHIEGDDLSFPPSHGDDFLILSLSSRDTLELPITPERAVRVVAANLGVRISRVPQLFLPLASDLPQAARWRLVLERPKTVVSARTGASLSAFEVFVGSGGAISVADPIQPETLTEFDPGTNSNIALRRRPQVPVQFEPIRSP